MTKQPNKPQATELLKEANAWAEQLNKERPDVLHNLRVYMAIPQHGQKLSDGWVRHTCDVSGLPFDVPPTCPIMFLRYDMEWGDEPPGNLSENCGAGYKIHPEIAAGGVEAIKKALLKYAADKRNSAAFDLQQAVTFEAAAALDIAIEWPAYWQEADKALQLVR